MTVECPSCGQVVQIPSFPGWCPACNRRISSLVPPLTSKTTRRQDDASSRAEASATPEAAESTYSAALPPTLQVPEELTSPERPLPYREPTQANPIDAKLWLKIGGAMLALVLAFVLVFAVVARTRAYMAARSAPPPVPAPPVTAPAPPPQQPGSIFDENFVASSEPAESAEAPGAAPRHAAPPPATAPQPRLLPPVMPVRLDDPPKTLTDQAIHDAIERGVSYLLAQIEKNGELRPLAEDVEKQMEGRFALVVLALLHAGQATEDPRLNMNGELMPLLINRMKRMSMTEGTAVYARSIRAMALAVHARRADRGMLAGDLEYLLNASMGGAYTYAMPTKEQREARFHDNSNTQYGNLGVWAAADAGLPVPRLYWEEVEKHWTDAQYQNGAWGYWPGADSRLTMTTGALTSLFVAGDMLAAARVAEGVSGAPFKPAVQRGLDWMAQGDHALSVAGGLGHVGYALYGLERAALASGFKRFGKHDWFRAHAVGVLETQEEDGSWAGADGYRPETSFRILFLARGRHPIMMNKLRFDGAWANRPRDVAKLSEFVYDTIERPVNWQVVTLEEGWRDWIDAPILYLASHDPVELTDDEIEQLRTYIEHGGLLFTHADADSGTFSAFADALAKRLFPQYEMRDLPPDHDVYSMIYRLGGEKVPPLRGLSNGTRLLMIHSPTDLAATWQNRLPKTRPVPFQLGANIFVYATGKAPLRQRLDTPLVPEPNAPTGPLQTFTVARVQHSGAWDPEPAAWQRMARWFRRETNVALSVVPTEAANLQRRVTPFAHLTTTSPWKPSEVELKAIRRFVRDGGLLLLDPAGGSPELALSLQRDIAQAAFPDQPIREVNEKDQFIGGTGAGMDELTRPLMRVYAVEQFGNELPPMQIMPVGRGWIVISSLDIVSGLLGTNSWGILGYDPKYAQPLMKNLILYACNGRSYEQPKPPPPTAPAAQTQESLPPGSAPAEPSKLPRVIEPPPAP